MSERTLYNWIQVEKWEKGKLVKNTELKAITKKLLSDKEERILDNSADELLLRAMSETFIHTQITKTALIAQSEFNRLASNSIKGSMPNPKVIQAAKDVVSIFVDMKKCLYPNQDNTHVNIKAILNNGVISKDQIASLSDE